jgi:hypothetical protein
MRRVEGRSWLLDPGSALGSGRGGRRFKSCHLDHHLAEMWIATATNNASADNTGRQFESLTELFIGPRHHDMMGKPMTRACCPGSRTPPSSRSERARSLKRHAADRCCLQPQHRNVQTLVKQ